MISPTKLQSLGIVCNQSNMAVNTIIVWVNINFYFGKQKTKNATFIMKVASSIIYKYVL